MKAKSDKQLSFRGIVTPHTLPLFAASLVVPMAAFLLYPFLTVYFTHQLAFSPAKAGLLLSIRFLSSALLGFVGGWVADRLGLVKTYMIAAIVTALAIGVLARQSQVLPILGLLVVLGVSSSTVNATVRGLANQATSESHRGMMQNVIHWLNNIGMAAALPISAFAFHAGFSRVPFFVAAIAYVVMAIALGLAFYFRSDKESDQGQKATNVSVWHVVRDDRAFLWLLISLLLWATVEMQFESNVPLDLSYHFAHGTELYGTLGALDMVIVFVLQLIVSQWLSRRRSPWYGYLGFMLLGGLAVGGLWQTTWGWLTAIILLSVGEVFSLSQIMAMMGVLPQSGRQGTYFALFGMAQGLATFVAYSLGSAAYQWLTPQGLFSLCIPLAILSAVSYRGAYRSYVARTSLKDESREA